MPQRPRSIANKLFWAIGLPGLAVAVLGLWLSWKQADRAVSQSSQVEAQALAEFVASTFSLTREGGPAQGSTHRAVAQTVRSDWRIFQHLRELRVVGEDGTVRWSRNAEEVGRKAPAGASLEVGGAVRVEGRRTEITQALGGMQCAGCHLERPMAVGLLQLSLDPPELQREVQEVFGLALSAVVLLFGLLLGLTVLSLHLLLHRPLRRLTAVMRRAEEGDFLVRAETRSGDELGQLSLAFNRMLAKITSMKAEEIDAHRDLERVHQELSLQRALEESHSTLHQRVKEQSLLFDVARSLTSTLELPELFGRVSSLLDERLGIPRFSIMLLEEGRLTVKTVFPPDDVLLGVSFAVGEGACGRAARTRAAVYIPDLTADGGLYARLPGERLQPGSLLILPMIHKGALLGVLNFERPEQEAFSAEEIELLSAVADLAAIATKNARLHEETVALSITDALTGAANRRHLFTRLEQELVRALRFGSQLSILMVDIDHFKHLNDAQGHRIGDEVLKQVCDVLGTVTRKVDVLARYGGEEFMLVLPQVDKAGALEVAEKLRRAVEEAPIEQGHLQPLGRLTVSVGVASLHEDAGTLEAFVDAADAALYASKRAGRNAVTAYRSGMEQHPGRERGPHAAKRRRTGETEKVGT